MEATNRAKTKTRLFKCEGNAYYNDVANCEFLSECPTVNKEYYFVLMRRLYFQISVKTIRGF